MRDASMWLCCKHNSQKIFLGMTEADCPYCEIAKLKAEVERLKKVEKDIQALYVNADSLLLELCEVGLYELGEEESPEGGLYNDLAFAANVLDDASKKMAEKYPNTTKKEQGLFGS